MTSSTSSSPLPWDTFDVDVGDVAEDAAVADGSGVKEESPAAILEEPAPTVAAVVELKKEDIVAAAARRAKAMSIGNAASLFGAAPPSPVNGDEQQQPEAGSSKAFAGAFASIGEEPEPAELIAGDGDAGDAANLFSSLAATGSGAGDSGSLAGGIDDWLSGQSVPAPATEAQPFEQSPQVAGDAFQLQQQQQQSDQQYAYYDQSSNGYAAQGQPYADQTSLYGYDGNASSNLYAGPSSQQAYQPILQAQAQAAAPQQAPYAQPYDGDMSSSYYQRQPQSAYQQNYQPQQYQPPQAGSYDTNSHYLYTPQHQNAPLPAPYTAPAGAAYANQMSYSQGLGPSAGSSAPNYDYTQQSQAYDPYAPSANDPYAAAPQVAAKPTLAHSATQPAIASKSNAYDPYAAPQYAAAPATLQHSATSAAITTVGSQDAGNDPAPPKAKELNRSKSSFFAELPPMPAPKSRPPSSMSNLRSAGSAGAVPPMPVKSAGGSPQIPPPSKSRTPAPPGRPGSAASISRPGSRTAQRQASTASSYGGRTSTDQSAQYAAYPSAASTYSAGQSSGRQFFEANQTHMQGSIHADPRNYATSPPPQQSQRSSYDAGPSYGQGQPYSQQHQQQAAPYDRVTSPQLNGYGYQQTHLAQSPYIAHAQNHYSQQSGPYGAYGPAQHTGLGASSLQQGSSQPQPSQSSTFQLQYSQQQPAELSPRSIAQSLPSIHGQSSSELTQPDTGTPTKDQSGYAQTQTGPSVQDITAFLQSADLDDNRSHRHRSETAAAVLSIAQRHDEVDELPVHAVIAASEEHRSISLEPHERSITLDAYAGHPSSSTDFEAEIGASATSPSQAELPVLAVFSPSPALAKVDFAESISTPVEEQVAEQELQQAENDLARQLYAEDGGELDMLVKPDPDTGLPASTLYGSE